MTGEDHGGSQHFGLLEDQRSQEDGAGFGGSAICRPASTRLPTSAVSGEDFDGAPRCYGASNPGVFGPTVNPASNPDTALQADIVARACRIGRPIAPMPARPWIISAMRPVLARISGSTNDFAWVGLTALAPSQIAQGPQCGPEKATHQCSQPRHAARYGRAVSQERTR